MIQGRPCRGNKRQQMLQTTREIKRQKREKWLNREEEVVVVVEELLARLGVEQDSELEESEADYSEDEDFEEKEDCEVTDSEEDPVKVDNSALQTLIASSQQLGFDAFEDNTIDFNYQRGVEPSVCTQYRQVQYARELEAGAKNTCPLGTYWGAQHPAYRWRN
ncbi:hypothetical protein FN846DRAFT_912443 [Sphaerosporella brunnea]|uniref:Uncharacterized protein n=1 Tax=Sphaerosporella brunnea TaxID=1250544 RepID=A0A5J5EJE2_9PEZI|nr:hypothetical protein FN846DRAFT_912443 [Sphaerosporella brunnea]